MAWKSALESIVLVAVLLTRLCAEEPVHPQEVVARLETHGMFSKKSGTAWCVDPECRLLVTNYHVVKTVGSKLKVKGIKVAEVTSATDEHDHTARVLPTAIGPLMLSYVRDIALLKMHEPLTRKGMRAVPFYLGQLGPGQEVTAFGFPGGKFKTVAGHFAEECSEGVLRFEMAEPMAAGFSGGLITDSEERAVGLLFMLSEDRRSAYAVPVWSLGDFIRKVQPELYPQLFASEVYRGQINGREAQREPEDTATDSVFDLPATPTQGVDPSPALPESYLLQTEPLATMPIERYDVSGPVLALRRGAREMSQQMKNFVARQKLLFANGRVWQHELQLIDGRQRFRTPDGKELFELPIPRGPVPGSEWADLVKTIGFNSSLAVQYEHDIVVGNQTVKVFRYQVQREDKICQLRIARPLRRLWVGSLPCAGVIWTDEQFRILRITQDMTGPTEAGVASFRIVILYGWWGPRLVPAGMYLRSVSNDGRTYSSRVKFDNYRLFEAVATINFGQRPLK